VWEEKASQLNAQIDRQINFFEKKKIKNKRVFCQVGREREKNVPLTSLKK
jgi:hypothetical protein